MGKILGSIELVILQGNNMSLLQKGITKLFRGVSTQPETNQLEGQVRRSINMMHSVEKGVSRRNPTELVAQLPILDTVNTDIFVHNYERGDGVEKYMMMFTRSGLKVFDLNGVEKVVNNGSIITTHVTNILNNGGKMSDSLRCLTVGDTTFVVNTRKVTAMSNTIDGVLNSHLNNPFYWIKRSFDNGAGTGYDYTLDGATVNAVKSSEAVNKLHTALGSTNYAKFGSILIRKNKPTSFIWSDSYGSQASEGFWGVAQKIEDLPNTMSGAELTYPIVVEIQGDPDNKFSNYWLQFIGGHWKETRKSGIKNTIDNTTMPFKITRNELGQFDVSYIDYAKREKGDEITAPNPSFIGNQISDIFFFKNRLCFISGENVIMSETGMYYNFYPTTVTDILPSDPIDVSVDTNSVAILKHAISFNDSVVLFSNGSQFNLKAQSVVSPNDVSITNTTNYNLDIKIKPISVGSSVFFMGSNLKGSNLREYFLDTNGSSNIAVDVSSHVDGYLPKNVNRLIGSTNNNIVMLTTSDEPNSIYVYKFFNSGEERIQTAWFKWTFTGSILSMFIIDDSLYLVKKDSRVTDKWLFEKLDYSIDSSVDVYLDALNTHYVSEVELSEIVLNDSSGKAIMNARSPLMYKTFQLTSTDESKYEIEVKHKVRDRIAKNQSVKDNKIMVQGKSNEIDLIIRSSNSEPLEFHTYTIEINHNSRAKII